jgi:predicted outer membrane repeat protein
MTSVGGAVSTVANLNDFDNVTLHDNHVLGPFGQGGAVFMNDIGVLHCDQCSFYSNTAEFGGAVAALDAQINMTNSSFTSNFATQYDGGAIYAVSTNITKMSLFGCNLTSNR